MKFDTEIAKTYYFDVEKRCWGLSCMNREIEGLLPEVRHQIIANFYGKNVSKGNMYSFQHSKQMGCKNKPAIYHIMWLVDAGVSGTEGGAGKA